MESTDKCGREGENIWPSHHWKEHLFMPLSSLCSFSVPTQPPWEDQGRVVLLSPFPAEEWPAAWGESWAPVSFLGVEPRYQPFRFPRVGLGPPSSLALPVAASLGTVEYVAPSVLIWAGRKEGLSTLEPKLCFPTVRCIRVPGTCLLLIPQRGLFCVPSHQTGSWGRGSGGSPRCHLWITAVLVCFLWGFFPCVVFT